MCVCVSACVSVCVCVCDGQKRASDPLELEWQVLVSHPTWVLEPDLSSSGRAASERSELQSQFPSLSFFLLE